jgi:trimeric autotransporter adhesin
MRHLKKLLTTAACLTIGCLAAASCTTSTDPTPIASIELYPGLDSLEVGQTFSTWLVIVKDASGRTLEGRQLTWESRNTTVATVDPNTGVVTAVGTGEASIVAKANGLQAIAQIRVLLPVVNVVAFPDSMDVALTTQKQIGVQVIGPEGVTLTNRVVAFSSDDPTTVVVSTSGVVTPLKVGTTSVRVRVSGVERAAVRVRVVAEPVTAVRILPQQSVLLVRVGQTRQLSAECLGASGQVLTGRTIAWNSDNPVVASVDQSGVVSGVSLGTVAVRVVCENATNAVTISVTPVRVASVAITPATANVRIGTQFQLNAVVMDSAGTQLSIQNRSVFWETNNFPVATVTQSGLVGGNGNGTAEIRVTVDGVVSPPAIMTVFTPSFALMSERPKWLNAVPSVGPSR